MRKILYAAVLLTVIAAVIAVVANFWSTSWPNRSPEASGVSLKSLKDLSATVGRRSRGVVIKDGHLIYAWGSQRKPTDWGSATKPFVSTLLLFALAERKLDSVDEPIRNYIDGLREKDKNITFRHLANMTSGYSLPEGPGISWEYNDYAIKLYFLVFFDRLLKLSLKDEKQIEQFVSDPKRLGALEFEDGRIFTIRNGVPRLYMSPRDFARVGWFWCKNGHWRERQLLPERLFHEYRRPSANADLPRSLGGAANDYLGIGSAGGGAVTAALKVGPGVYGFNWWFNSGKRLWPDLPPDTFQANGHWNLESLIVLPSLGVVVAWADGDGVVTGPENFGASVNNVLKPLVQSILQGGHVVPC